MKLAIVGAGVADPTFGNRLQEDGHQIEIFEASRKESHWLYVKGASKNMLEIFSKNGTILTIAFFIAEKPRMNLPDEKIEYLELRGLVTYDKYHWEQDLPRIKDKLWFSLYSRI